MPYEDSKQNAKNYQWPANKLTAIEMAILYRLREQTGMPINFLLREAVLQFKIPANVETEPLANLGANHAKKE